MVATLLSTYDVEWLGVIHEQTPRFMKGAADETVRRRMLLSYLRKYGRIVLNANSPVCIWNIKYKQQPIESAGDGGTLTFTRHDLYKQAALNWRGYVGTDMMTEKEYLMNQGPGRILNRYSEVIPSLMEAMTDNFGGEMILDGEAADRQNNLHGIESFMGSSTTVAGDLIAKPSDSYAGLSTAVGAEGGSWSTALGSNYYPNASIASDWPNGKGSYQYDYYSPLLLNASSTRWGTGSTEFEANCERIVRQGIIWLANKGGQSGRPKMVLLSADYYSAFLNHLAVKQRVIVPHKESQDLGFEDTVNFDGVSVAFDYEVPSRTGYMLNVQNMELASLDKVLFGYRGPDWSMRDRAWLFYVGFWGNMRYRPKHFGKIYPYA
jgi:hypothetical protein